MIFFLMNIANPGIIRRMNAAPELNQPLRAKLIYNPMSGGAIAASMRLRNVITELQELRILPEVYLVQDDSDLKSIVGDALRRRFELTIVCGGDGTVDSVAAALACKRMRLGILPAGTQNNIALSLGIPVDLHQAAALLRSGQQISVDLGVAICQGKQRLFLEACSVGLLSALFPAADDIQHGNLARIGDLLATLVTSQAANISLRIENERQVDAQGHVVLAANMPYLGPHFPVTSEHAFNDGFLDVLVFANLSKLELLGNAVQTASGGAEDARIRRFRAHSVTIDSHPPMPVMVDGFPMGEGQVHLQMKRKALTIIAGEIGRNSRENSTADSLDGR
jgi:diacylglycerol kinase (ATP)